MEKTKNKKNFKNSIKETFNYFEYYIVDNNTVSNVLPWGRILLTIPFLEDSLLIIYNWNNHINYYGINSIILKMLLICLIVGSVSSFHKSTLKYGVYILIATEIIKLVLFEQIFNITYYLKLICNLNGLILLLAEVFLNQSSEVNKILLFEQPKILKCVDENSQKNITLLKKCVILLYTLSIFLSKKFNIFIVIAACFSIIALGLVIFGANNNNSFTYFIFILSILNLAINNYWTSNEVLYITKFQISQALTMLSGVSLFISN
ncbi:hypothetical protein BCR36DRAFT_410317 [Piromyces finnis]|uniref:SURF4-domain-containing protein n=1 Tax=Piromyces finnis TaxID=1754191 RepID=A0A1Y1VG98_9FUNG|nr:hypothetical protein BCR36DRAFT_410317 [Piromyces finnis]|eukprot:ORX55389.1 hypothetical protein BCR36DRAFT_410317 [Piromyces finnis]